MIYTPDSLLNLDPGTTDYVANSPKSVHSTDMLEVQT